MISNITKLLLKYYFISLWSFILGGELACIIVNTITSVFIQNIIIPIVLLLLVVIYSYLMYCRVLDACTKRPIPGTSAIFALNIVSMVGGFRLKSTMDWIGVSQSPWYILIVGLVLLLQIPVILWWKQWYLLKKRIILTISMIIAFLVGILGISYIEYHGNPYTRSYYGKITQRVETSLMDANLLTGGLVFKEKGADQTKHSHIRNYRGEIYSSENADTIYYTVSGEYHIYFNYPFLWKLTAHGEDDGTTIVLK